MEAERGLLEHLRHGQHVGRVARLDAGPRGRRWTMPWVLALDADNPGVAHQRVSASA
jgi:hypothetical protein